MDIIMTKFNSKDLEGLGKLVHPDIIIRNLENNNIIVEGKDAMLNFYRELFEKDSSINTIVEMMTLEDKVVFTEHIKEPYGTAQDEFNMMEFENGLIKRIWFLEE